MRCDYGLGCRVIVICIGRIVVAIPWPPWPYADNLTIAEKMMSGEASKVRKMASSVKRAHAHAMHAHAMASSTCVNRHKE